MYTDIRVVIQRMIIIQDVEVVIKVHMEVREYLNLVYRFLIFNTYFLFSTGYSRSRDDHHSHNDGNHGGGGGGYNRSRNDHHSNSSGSNDSGIEIQRDTIFIQNLPRNVTAADLKDVFSQIGVIKVRY
jgi:hypothetical protein